MSIADRVQERLHALQLNPAETARKAGLARTFVSDLLNGKKRSVRHAALVSLARVLECDVDYLTEAQTTPRRSSSRLPQVPEIALQGICETGVWRSPGAVQNLARIPISPDPRFLDKPHLAFLVRGRGAERIGIDDGMIVIGVSPSDDLSATRDLTGAPLVIRRTRQDTGEVEMSIRTIEATMKGAVLSAPTEKADEAPIRFPPAKGEPTVEVVAVILRAVRFFGSRT